jgi:hypothetical protein
MDPGVAPSVATLTFTSEPLGGTGRQPFTIQPVVHDVDSGGNPVVGDSVTIGILPDTGAPGAILSCTGTNALTDPAGNATFSGCLIEKLGAGYRLIAQSPAATAPAMSDPFDIAVGPPVQLTFLGGTAATYVGHPFDAVVGITDNGMNVVASGVSATITLGVGPDVAEDVVLACPGGLSRPTLTSGPAAGTATFSGCTLDRPIGSDADAALVAIASAVSGAALLAMGASGLITVRPGTEAPLPALVLLAPGEVTWGQPATFGIAFTGGASLDIDIQRSIDAATWTSIGHVTTDASGQATLLYRPRTSGYYRAVYAGPPTSAAGSTDPDLVQVRLLVSQVPVHTATAVIRRGTSITFSATVRPVGPDLASRAVTFLVYRQVAGAWQLTATRVVAADGVGVARFTWRFGTAGEFYVRSKASRPPGDPATPGPNLISALTPIARYTVR